VTDAGAKARLLREAATREPVWIAAQGASMGRTIPSGSSVRIAGAAAPRGGQVWAYLDGSGSVVVHRYRRHSETGHVLQGDASPHPDAPVGTEQLIGRVTAVRCAGRVRSVGSLDRWGFEFRRVRRALRVRASWVRRRLGRAA
jgi:hypothetical protein